MGLVKMYDYFDSVRAVCSDGVLVDDVCNLVLVYNKWCDEVLGVDDYGSRLSDIIFFYSVDDFGNDRRSLVSYIFENNDLSDAVELSCSVSRMMVYMRCGLVDFSIFDELI